MSACRVRCDERAAPLLGRRTDRRCESVRLALPFVACRICTRPFRFRTIMNAHTNDSSAHGLARLMATIEDRRANPPAKSYTTTLFAGGVRTIGEKICEEAAEVVEAAGEPEEAGRKHLIREAADLIYHLFVMLAYRQVSLSEVEAELTRRAGTSGLDEKASRPKPQ